MLPKHPTKKLSLSFEVNNWVKILAKERKQCQYIEILELNGCQIRDCEVKHITDINWPNLQKLDLGSNELSPTGLQTLLKAPLPSLTHLFLYGNKIGNVGFEQLITWKGGQKLKEIYVVNNGITGAGLRGMVDVGGIGGMWGIRVLDFSRFLGILDYNLIGIKGVKYLTKSYMPLLQKLALRNSQIGTQQAKHLTKAKWPKLAHLILNQNKINFDGYSALTNFQLQNLAELSAVWKENLAPIQVLIFVTGNCGRKTRIVYGVGNRDMGLEMRRTMSCVYQ